MGSHPARCPQCQWLAEIDDAEWNQIALLCFVIPLLHRIRHQHQHHPTELDLPRRPS